YPFAYTTLFRSFPTYSSIWISSHSYTLFPYTTLFRSTVGVIGAGAQARYQLIALKEVRNFNKVIVAGRTKLRLQEFKQEMEETRSEEHTSELQSRFDFVCRLMLGNKKRSEKQTSEVIS